MALDVLILGPFEFADFAVPNELPFGGAQKMTVHKMPGGGRVIDCMGPDDQDIAWSGRFFTPDALAMAQTLNALRTAGKPLPYSNGVESRTVVISEFRATVHKFNWIEYEIVVVPADTGAGAAGGGDSVTSLISSDFLSAASSIGLGGITAGLGSLGGLVSGLGGLSGIAGLAGIGGIASGLGALGGIASTVASGISSFSGAASNLASFAQSGASAIESVVKQGLAITSSAESFLAAPGQILDMIDPIGNAASFGGVLATLSGAADLSSALSDTRGFLGRATFNIQQVRL